MESAARDVDKHDREAEKKDGKATKTNGNGTKVKFAEKGSINKRGPHKEKSNHQRGQDVSVRASKGRAPKSTDVHKRKETQSRRDKQRRALFNKVSKNRTFLFDKKRNGEFKRDFKESDDDEPDWDPRLREIKAKFEEVTLKKKREARKIWTEIEEARSDSDSANEKETSDEDESEIHSTEDKRKQKLLREKEKEDAENKKNEDGSDGDAWFWDSEVKNTLEGLKDTRSEGKKRGTKGNDSDEDPWFWDSNGNAPVTSTSKRNKKAYQNTSDDGGTSVPIGLKKRLGAQLKNSIEKVQLAEFRKEYYEKLSDAKRISDSSSKDSSSSTSSTPSSLSSDIEDLMGNPKARKELKRYLDNSSDDDDVIVYTRRGWTIKRAPVSTSKIIPGRKKGRRNNWSDQSSESSTTTSSSDTEKSNGSQNGAATDKH